MKKVIVASMAAWFCIPLWGQQANAPDLAAQNAALEQKVRDLEDRMIALEGKVRLLQSAPTAPAAQPAAEGQPAEAASAQAASQPTVSPVETSPNQGQSQVVG